MTPTKLLKSAKVQYKTSLVTYIDILGFRRLLQEKSAGQISRVLRVVKEAARRDEKTEADFDRLYENFSDLTVRSVNVSSADYVRLHPALLEYELESIAKVQIELLQKHHILIRGGIALGQLAKSWGLVYGAGLVNAYELETKAKHPRIAIHDDLIRIVESVPEGRRFASLLTNLISSDKGCHFVDYFRYAWRHFEEGDDLLDFAAQHKTVIEEGLARFASEPKTEAKFKWLKRYHNSTIQLMPLPAMVDDYLVG